MKLTWSKDSRADLAGLHRYYRDIDPEVSVRIVKEAVAAARFLALHPSIGSPLPETNKQKWRVPETRYILIYRIEGDHLRIIRVLHGARNWQTFLG